MFVCVFLVHFLDFSCKVNEKHDESFLQISCAFVECFPMKETVCYSKAQMILSAQREKNMS